MTATVIQAAQNHVDALQLTEYWRRIVRDAFIAGAAAVIRQPQREPKARGLEKFVRRASMDNASAIVCTSALIPEQIDAARTEGRLFVMADGIGFALRTTPPPAQSTREAIADRIVRDVCELGDRSSPDDWPEAMIVTADELKLIVLTALEEQQ